MNTISPANILSRRSALVGFANFVCHNYLSSLHKVYLFNIPTPDNFHKHFPEGQKVMHKVDFDFANRMRLNNKIQWEEASSLLRKCEEEFVRFWTYTFNDLQTIELLEWSGKEKRLSPTSYLSHRRIYILQNLN